MADITRISILSEYAEGLTDHARRRYEAKINCIDPFLLFDKQNANLAVPGSFPQVEASDIVSYLVLQTNFISSKQFRAHKSLDAYNQFVNGLVKDVKAWTIVGHSEIAVVTGKVSSRHA